MRVTLAGVTKGFGAHTVLSDVTLDVGPRSRLGVVGPNGVGQVDAAAAARRAGGAGRGRRHARPAHAHGGLPAAGGGRAARARRCSATSRGARGGGGAGGARAARRRAGRGSTAGEAYAAALERFLVLGGGDLEPRARAVCADLGLPVELERPMTDAVRRRGGPRRAGGAAAGPLRPLPPGRAHERPRLRRPRPPGALGVRRWTRRWSSSRTTASSSTAR